MVHERTAQEVLCGETWTWEGECQCEGCFQTLSLTWRQQTGWPEKRQTRVMNFNEGSMIWMVRRFVHWVITDSC